jgi:hypothetical protein
MEDVDKRLTITQSEIQGRQKRRHRFGLGESRPKMSRLSPISPMRVWTIQPMEVMAQLKKKRILYANSSYIPREFCDAYDWMRAQMKRRISSYSGHYPWWGWHSPRPDLRRSGHLPRGTQGVRLELELEPAEVLLSDFDAWHAVLNRGYLGLSEAEDDAWYERFEAAVPNRWAWPPPEPWYSDILTSWERIFDLETLAVSEYWQSEPRYIQATFEALRLVDVRKCTPFVAR